MEHVLAQKSRFTLILGPVTSSVFVFECINLLLEDEAHSTHYHEHTTKNFLAQKFPLRPHLETSNLQCCYFKEWLTTSAQLFPSMLKKIAKRYSVR